MKNLAVSLVLDRSGSMASNWPKTIDACNEYLNGLKSNGADTVVTVTVFDSESIDRIRNSEPAATVKQLNIDEVTPRGSTPLLDAVGRAITHLDQRTPRDDEGVVLVVMTDGQENASHEYKLADIKARLTDLQTNHNWMVIFLGEGLNAWGEGAKIGTYAGSTIQYDAANIQSAMRSASVATASFLASGSNNVNFSDEDRAKAMGEGTGDFSPNPNVVPLKTSHTVKETNVRQWK